MKIKILITTLGLMFFIKNIQCQDLHFTQYYLVPVYTDPSQTGKFMGNIRGTIGYRNQWNSVTKFPYVTYGGIFDMPLNVKNKKGFWGVGLSIYSDKAGEGQLGTTQGNFCLAYHIRTSEKSFLSAGISIGGIQRSLNVTQLRFENQFDGKNHNASISSGENWNNQSFIRPSMGTGISYSWGDDESSRVLNNNNYSGKKFNIGISVFNLNSPSYSFLKDESDKLALRYCSFFIGSIGNQNNNLAVQPTFLINYQNKAIENVMGLLFRYSLNEESKYTKKVKGAALSMGILYRWKDAAIPTFMIESGSLTVGISYDINVSELTTSSRGRGGLEIMIRYINPNPFSSPNRSQSRFF